MGRHDMGFSANKLREKQLHPLLAKLGIPRGGFHSMRHGAASALLADGIPAVVQKQLRHSDPRNHAGNLRSRRRRCAAECGSESIDKAGELGPIVRTPRFVTRKRNKCSE